MTRKGWIVTAVCVALLGGAMTRAIVNRKAEKAALVQSGASTGGAALTLRPGDWFDASVSTLKPSLPVSGTLKAVRAATIKARVAGELLELGARPGEPVKAGQLVARIDAGDSQQRFEQARQQAASAEAQLAIARQTLENNQALVRDGFISRTALDTSSANFRAAQANLDAARAAAEVARKTLADTRLLAPFNGQVSQQMAQVGERLAIDARIVDIVDPSDIELEAALSVAELQGVRPGMTGFVRIEGLNDPIGVTVARINPGASAGSRAVTVYLKVARHPMARHGLFVQGQLALESAEGIVIPRSVVRQGAEGRFVVLVKDGKVEHRRIEIGGEGFLPDRPQEPMVLVRSGLKAGERVLRDTVGLLQPGTRLN